MAKQKFHYEVNEHGDRLEVEGFACDDEFDYEMLAQTAAKDYHRNHDGWESSWPVDMVIYAFSDAEDGKELWRGEVDREAVPSFRASTKKLN